MVSKLPILAPKYSLIAVQINHYGTPSGGHCKPLHLFGASVFNLYLHIHSDVAYFKRENGWYSFDDTTVSSITEAEIVV